MLEKRPQLLCLSKFGLTHWGRVTHICVSKLTIIGSDNGLSPDRRQAIIWTNAGILLIGRLGTNFSEILIKIPRYSFSKMHLKMWSATWRLFGLGLNELTCNINWNVFQSFRCFSYRYVFCTCLFELNNRLDGSDRYLCAFLGSLYLENIYF